MRILKQILIILLLCLGSEAISKILPFSFPSSIISMLLLFVLLTFKIIKPEHIKDTAEFFIKNMAFFFIPAGVAILEKYQLIQSSLIQILIIIIITTILTFIISCYTVIFFIKLINRQEAKRHDRTNH